MKTRTGQFPIGFRRGGSAWQQDLDGLLTWAKAHDLFVVDMGGDGDVAVTSAIAAGIRIGSVDVPDWKGLITADETQRSATVAKTATYIETCAAAGAQNFFLVMLPADPSAPCKDNFELMVKSFTELTPVLEANNARIVIEGWPGPGSLVCTPETFRAFFKACPSPAMGVNYDPSHLLRMGIDPLRFASEFAERIYHVHGKDTEFLIENMYEFGHELPATFASHRPYAGWTWRYAIPGHGQIRWTEIFRVLESKGYQGCVSIELEDADFNGAPEGEKLGILKGAQFLEGC